PFRRWKSRRPSWRSCRVANGALSAKAAPGSLGVTVSVMSERGGERKPPQRWGAARYTAAAARVIASNSRATVGGARTRSTQARPRASGTEWWLRVAILEILAADGRIEDRDLTVDQHGNLAVPTHRQELRWLRPPERLPAPWHHERLVPELLFRERDAYLGAERTQHPGPELHAGFPPRRVCGESSSCRTCARCTRPTEGPHALAA